MTNFVLNVHNYSIFTVSSNVNNSFWYLGIFFSICNEFEGIKEQALKIPEDTREMTDMMKFIKDAKTTRLVKLNEQIKVRLDCYYVFLPGYISNYSTCNVRAYWVI